MKKDIKLKKETLDSLKRFEDKNIKFDNYQEFAAE